MRYTIRIPRSDQIRYAPDLAVLAALQAALAATVNTLIATHPELLDDAVDPGERTIEIADAETIARQATELIARIDHYCYCIDNSDDDPF